MHDGYDEYDYNEYSEAERVAIVKEKKKLNRFITFVVIFIIGLIVFCGCMVTTHEDEYKVIKQFGSIVRVESEPGLSFKIPILQNVTTIDNKLLFYDIPRSDVITSDKKTMIVDSYVVWRITDPEKFMKTLSGSNTNAEGRLNTVVYNAIKNTISGMTQEEVIVSRDGNVHITTDDVVSSVKIVSLTEAISKNISDCSDYGIEIVKAEVKVLDLPDSNKQAVYQRMISERTNVAASYKAQGESEAQLIVNEADKTVSIMLAEAKADAEKIIAEGEAEYMRILSNAYNDESKSEFYSFVRALDAAKIALSNSGDILILDEESPIAQIFYSK